MFSRSHNNPPPKFLAIANDYFSKKQFAEALDTYELALSYYPALYKVILPSLKRAKCKLDGVAPDFSRKYKLLKPVFMESDLFKKIEESGLFDPAWYFDTYGSDYSVCCNPLEHYLLIGSQKGLNPSPQFNTNYYIWSNPDLKKSKIHPFIHYVCQGMKEGRKSFLTTSDDSAIKHTEGEFEYIHRIPTDSIPTGKAARIIAFYLPQFHTIPENDKWWGTGFTEWTNVKLAEPQFQGHYQPHIPDNFLGYYSLLDRATQVKQVGLAKQYGIEGFCFYLYWFTGHKLLEQPIDNYLADPGLDLPFCICWANENWSRRWDGLDQDLLIEQRYSEDDDIAFIVNAAKYLRDPRYIRVNGKPLLLVYRPKLFPNIKATARRWRDWCLANEIGEIYLTYPQSFEIVDPREYGFDAACEFPPNNSSIPNITYTITPKKNDFSGNLYDWRALVERSKNYKNPEYKIFRGVNPSWDNTARRKNKGSILLHSSPCDYQNWLYNAIVDTRVRFENTDERLVFVNAWNEWAEGAHLEPDQRYGYAYLEATRLAQSRIIFPKGTRVNEIAIILHAFYEDIMVNIIQRLGSIKTIRFKIFVSTTLENSKKFKYILDSSKLAYELFVMDNRGRDVLPFLKVMKILIQQGYAYGLKIHTKKSKHRNDGDIWRNNIFEKLLGDGKMLSVIERFNKDTELGIVGPEGHLLPMSYYFGSNKKAVSSLASRLGMSLEQISSLFFPAGNMFYFRIAALTPLLNLAISDQDFELEAGQIDGTLAHAIERATSISCASAKFTLLDTNFHKPNYFNGDYDYAIKTKY